MKANKALLDELIDAAYESGYYSGRGYDGSDSHMKAIDRRRRLAKEVLKVMNNKTSEENNNANRP